MRRFQRHGQHAPSAGLFQAGRALYPPTMRRTLAAAFVVALLPFPAFGELGPTVSVSREDFLKAQPGERALYVAGLIDGMSFTSYVYSLPAHDQWVACAQARAIGDTADGTADWLRRNPDSREGIALALAKYLAEQCKKPRP